MFCPSKEKDIAIKRINILLEEEASFNLQKLETYLNFQIKVDKIKKKLISFLINQKNNGKRIAAIR